MRTEITAGQSSDYLGFNLVMAENLPTPSVLLADRGYDADSIRKSMDKRDVLPVIPMRKSRKKRVGVDRALYRLRKLVERCFNKLKNARRVATRYDKTAESFVGFIDITSIRLWLRHLSTRPSDFLNCKATSQMPLIGYARASTEDQNSHPQVQALTGAGCQTVLQEQASGGDRTRPVLARLLDRIERGDTLLVVRIDRLARSLSHLLEVIERIEAKGAHFRSLEDPIDTASPQGKFTLQVLGAAA